MPQELDAARELAEIEQQRAELQARIDAGEFALPVVAEAYTRAADQLGERALQLAQNPQLQSGYASYGLEALAGLKQIEPLRNILPQEEFSALEQELGTRIMTVREFFESYGAHTDDAEKFLHTTPAELAVVTTAEITAVEPTAEPEAEPQPEPQPAPTETEGNKKSVKLTIGLNLVRIGKQGGAVPYVTNFGAKDKRDYTEPRRRALEAVLSLPEGELLSSKQLHELAFPGEEFQSNRMNELDKWFDKLTFRKEAMIVHKGRRYGVSPNFDLSFSHGERYKKHLAGEQTEPAVEAEPQPDSEISYALWLMSDRLYKFGYVMEAAGYKTISKDLWEQMDEGYHPDHSHLSGDADAVLEYRAKALEKLEELLTDSDAFESFYDNCLREGSVLFKFTELALEFDEEARKLIWRLVNAHEVRATVTGRLDVVGGPKQVYDSEGVLIYPFPELLPIRQGNGTETPVDDSEPDDEEPEADDDATTPGETETPQPEDGATDDEAAPAAPKSETELSPAEKSKLVKLREEAERIAEQFLATTLSPLEAYPWPQIQGAGLRAFSAKKVAAAKDKHVVPRGDNKTYGIKEVIRVLISGHKQLQNIFANRRYRAEVERIIDEVVDAALEKFQKSAKLAS
ncbi:MAG TPA: hypothetical protein VMT23_01340 [Candidatus Binatia bacterium]|nr:hypothetical protein [Candidatus Binatia bacterium]